MRRIPAVLAVGCAIAMVLMLAGCGQGGTATSGQSGAPAAGAGASSGGAATSASGAATSAAQEATTDAKKDAGAKPGVATLAIYNKVQKGMTYDQVIKITGPPAVNLGEGSSGDIHVASYGWYGPDGLSPMVVSFTNGKVNAKNQQGLK